MKVNCTIPALITDLPSPWNFSVRQDDSLLDKLMEDLQEYYSKLSSQDDNILNPVVGMACVAQFSCDNQWYRATVLQLKPPGHVLIFYVDYGNQEVVEYSKLKSVNDQFLGLPEMSIKCSLANTAPINEDFTSLAIEEMGYFGSNNRPLTIVITSQKNDIFEVVIFNEFKMCINKLLVECGYVRSTESRSLSSESGKDGEDPNFPATELLQPLEDGLHPDAELILNSQGENFSCNSLSLPEKIYLHDEIPLKQEVTVFVQDIKCSNSESTLDISAKAEESDNSTKLSYVVEETKLLEDLFESSSSEQGQQENATCFVSQKSRRCRKSVQDRLKKAQSNAVLSKCGNSVRIPVEVLNAESPDCIFVRLLNQKEKIERLMSEMLSTYESDGYLKESQDWTPDVRERCAVKCGLNWYRALVLEKLPDAKFKVMLKDVGRTEVVERNAVRMLYPIFWTVRDGSLKCHLVGIKVAGGNVRDGQPVWSTLSREHLNDLITEFGSHLFIAKRGQVSLEERSLPIELWVCHNVCSALEPTREEWFTINKRLIEKGSALPDPKSATLEEESLMTENDLNMLNPVDDPDSTMLEWLIRTDQESSLSDTSEDCRKEDLNDRDWPKPEAFPTDEFEGLPTYVDHECFEYLNDI